MVDKAYLLNPEDIRDFIVNGYIQIQTDFPTDLHGDIYQQIEEMLAKEGNPGNNLLPRIPDIQRVFEHPKVCGALTSLLGPDYLSTPTATATSTHRGVTDRLGIRMTISSIKRCVITASDG